MIEPVYTVKRLAERLGYSKRTIWRWVDDGLFPHAKKINRKILIPEKDVLALLGELPPPTTPSPRRIISRGVE